MRPALGARSLHVWRIEVRQPRDVLRELRALLTPDEEERAERFRFDRDRDSFVCTRAALRMLAGSYLGMAPQDVSFSYAGKGKPGLPGISFNVSHAGDVALAAFARSGRVGVDVEEMRPGTDLRALARRFFSPGENAGLERLDGDAFVTGFYRCWTRKEAFVKALGEGLSFDLGRVEVSTGPDARVVSVDGDEGAGSLWSIADISPRDGYAGAVVADVAAADVVLRDWPGLSVTAV
ncbi:MAG: 4'-phosphopantetheinyl transferase superfamily protein [Actinomycetota bacterium]|nr:4'-phosphopantetheinyl transferase superfamily protein [Actinomycetota bacterium]